jgi:outer membrane receptor for ferrienterochelin and colicins
MSRLYPILFFLFGTTFYSIGQKSSDANIYGHVVDAKTGEHLPFINISLKGTTLGVVTDLTGHYLMTNLPTGKIIVVASSIGYTSIEKEIEIKPKQSVQLDFEIAQDAVMLESVVVSANRNESNRKDAPAIVNVLTPALFQNTNSVSLGQGLNFQSGLRVETNCQSCGYQEVRINGLDGPYSQILIDSRAIFSSLAGVYGLEQIPANMIERVEVVRGGGSALFGSNAIAGTINIITREPGSNTVSIAHTTNLIGGRTPDMNTNFNASVVADNHRSGVMFFGAVRQRNPFDYDNDGFTDMSRIKSNNLGFKSYFRPNLYGKFTLEYHNISEDRRGGNLVDLPAHEADVADEIKHNIHTGGMKYDWFSKNYKHTVNVFSSAQHIARKSYYGAQKNLDAYGNTGDLSFVGGLQYNYSMDKFLFLPADLTMGAEYSLNDLRDENPGYNRLIDQTVHIQSIFIQNEWKNKRFSLLAGTRFDNHSLMSKPVLSPRFNVRYSPTSLLNFRASYSTGFRAPQAFDQDLHISIAGGEPVLTVLDQDLRPERSGSFSLSADIYYNVSDWMFNLLIEGFRTNLNDVFVLTESGEQSGGQVVMVRTNGKGALVQGINLEGRIIPFQELQIQFGATFQKSEYVDAQSWSESITPQKRMFRTPDNYAFLVANYNPVKNFRISLSGTYTGSMLVRHYAGYIETDREVETPEFIDLSLKLSYDLKLLEKTRIQINGGIQNMFNSYQKDKDQGPDRDSSFIYGPAMPRTLFFGAKIEL